MILASALVLGLMVYVAVLARQGIDRDGYETFCANAAFIERMKRFAVR